MLYLTPITDFGKGYYSVEIQSSDRELKKGDIFCSRGYVLNIIDADNKVVIIRFLNGHDKCFKNIGEMEWFYWTKEPVVTTDWTYMPLSIGPDYQGKVRTTVTMHPEDSRKIISLHTKFLPTMNAYSTLVIKKDNTTSATTKKAKPADLVILPYEVRLGRSEENVRAELLRLIPE